jgi:hypothetical protein
MDSNNKSSQPNKYKDIDLVFDLYECTNLYDAFQLINSKIGYPGFLYTDETKRNSLNDMIQNSTIVNLNDKLTFKLKGVNESGEQETQWMEELIDIMYDLMWDRKDVYISMAYHGDEDNIVEINDNDYINSYEDDSDCDEDDSDCDENNHCTQSHGNGDSDQEAEDDDKSKSSGDSECEDDDYSEDDDCPDDDYKCKEFILDFSNCRHKGDAFKLFRKVIGFIGFGYSLDSLVDILRGDYGHFTYKDNVLLRIRGRQNAEINILDWAKMVEIMSLRKKVKVQFEDDEYISDMPDWDSLVEII